MDHKHGGDETRDFLGEAARLALQLDPLAWEFDLSDRSQTPIQQAKNGERSPSGTFKHITGTDNWMEYQGLPTFLPSISQSTSQSQLFSHPSYDLGDAANLRMPSRTYDQVTAPGHLDMEAYRHRPSTDPMYLDEAQMEQLQHYIDNRNGSNNRPPCEGAWQYAQGMRPWNEAEGVKAKGDREPRFEGPEMAAMKNELEQLRKERDLLENHTKVLEKALMNLSQDSQPRGTPDFIPSRGWSSFDPHASVIVDTLFDPPKRISAEDAANIPLREYAMLWRSYLSRIQEVMKDCRPSYLGDPTPAEQKLKALLTERHGFLSWVAANNPSICHCLLTMDMGSDPPQKITAGLSSEKTQEMLTKMALTDEQSEFLLEARNQYLLSMGYHSASLRQLQKQLSTLDPTPEETVRNCHFLNWLHVARTLQETVEEMHICGITFHCKLYKMSRGITPYQAAILMIESYPYLPDVIALVSELAAGRSAPSADDLFRLGEEHYLANPAATELQFVREPRPSANDRIGKITELLQQWEIKRSKSGGDN